jgi:peptide/nickel transport system substrate-binding protein
MPEFRLLGSLEAGGSAGSLGSGKQRALLAYLLLRRNEAVPREDLIDALWGDDPPASAAHAVDVYASRLRKALGTARALERRGGSYRLSVPDECVDVARFEYALAELMRTDDPEAVLALAERALALWRGRALADLLDAPFARLESERLEEERLVVCEARFDALLALGRHDEAIGALQAFTTEHPLRERPQRQLMHALYRAGRQREALDVYRTARATLHDELGLEPGPELRDIEAAILRHDPELAAPVRQSRAAGPVGRRAPRRRTMLAAALVGVLAAAVAVPLFAISSGGPAGSPASAIVAANAVGAVDRSTGDLVASVPLAASPEAIAYGQGSLWVTMPSQDSVSRIDPRTKTVEQTVPTGNGPTALAVGGGFVWVADSLGGTVAQIDPRTHGGQVVNRILVGNRPTGIAYGLGAVWVANSAGRTVVRIDPVRGTEGEPIPVEAGADAIAVGGDAVWVVSEQQGVVSRIDPAAGRVTATVTVGNAPVAIIADARAVWAANSEDATVSRIDPTTNRVQALIQVGEGPSALALSSRGTTVWVSSELAGTIQEIDPALDKAVKAVTVGGLPQGVALSEDDTPYVAVRDSGSAHRGGTLTLAVPNPPGIYEVALPHGLDPAYGWTAWEMLTMTNDGLLGYGRSGGVGSYRVVPDLASTLPAVGNGGRRYTFQLRPGIRYSNGALVRPVDIRRGIERALIIGGGKAPSSYLAGIVGATACATSPKRCDLSKGIVVDTDSTTVTFNLTAPDPDFLYKLALPVADAVPATTPLHARLPLPATGPYMVAGYDAKRGVIRLVRNPAFRLWSAAAQPAGFPDRIVERYGYSGAGAVRAVQRGTADITADGPDLTWPRTVASSLRRRYSSRLYHAPVAATAGVWLNTRMAPFDDVRVRRAVNYAVDRDHLIELAGGPDLAQVGCQILPPNTDGYRPYCPYTLHPGEAGTYSGPDLDEARKLVAASGTKGQAITVWFFDIPIGRRNGAYFVSVLRKLGYDAHLETVPHTATATYAPRRQAGVSGWGTSYPSANDVFSSTFTCGAYTPARPSQNWNPAGFCSRRIDAEIARARALQTADPHAASALWTKIDREITDLAPWVVIRTGLAPDFVSRRTGNYTYCYLTAQTGMSGACLDQLWVR